MQPSHTHTYIYITFCNIKTTLLDHHLRSFFSFNFALYSFFLTAAWLDYGSYKWLKAYSITELLDQQWWTYLISSLLSCQRVIMVNYSCTVLNKYALTYLTSFLAFSHFVTQSSKHLFLAAKINGLVKKCFKNVRIY